jgi:hypothetical protein
MRLKPTHYASYDAAEWRALDIMEQISIQASKASSGEIVLRALGLIGLFAAAVLSNVNVSVATYALFASLGSVVISIILKMIRPKVSWPLIEDHGDYAYVSKFKEIPFLGLIRTASERIAWCDITNFKATFFPHSVRYGLGLFWYCIERNDRTVIETFLSNQYAESIYSLIDLVQLKAPNIEITLTNVAEK